MISYAQNQEDVVLSRLLHLIPRGSFIDVGAGHPIIHNVTYALYLEGWRGINVEPMAREAAMLREERPDDITLQIALGAEHGSIQLYEAPLENRGATTSDGEVAGRYASEGQVFEPFEVEMWMLNEVITAHMPGEIHILKIDVEGAEPAVLKGLDLSEHRPWVLVIEATEPNSTVDSSQKWEGLVLSAGYALALFDGLNRFYVRGDLPEVSNLLRAPANVFDDWTSMATAELKAELGAAQDQFRLLHEKYGLLHEKYGLLHEKYGLLHEQFSAEIAAATAYAEDIERHRKSAEEYAFSLEAELRRIRGSG